ADLVVEGLGRVGREQAGLGYQRLAQEHPALVQVSVTAFGDDGPYADYRINDLTAMAVAGMMYMTGDPEREPLANGASLALYGTGQYAFTAALAALLGKRLTGRGRHIEVSVARCEAASIEVSTIQWIMTGQPKVRLGNWDGRAGWGVYPAADGYVGVVMRNRENLRDMAHVMGNEELAGPRFDDFRFGQSAHVDEVNAALVEWLSQHPKEEVYHAAQARHLPFGYVCDAGDLLRSAHLRERRFFLELDHPVVGRLTYPTAPYRMSNADWRWERPPLLGEHNEEVFCGRLGLAREDLVHLRAAGVL
ncbi:MAG: CoA transferase, partial [Chloroflexi bacterium]|nr:CoA transferase [Chloroflexota bacterium]